MSTEVRVPTLGESVTEATVATWFKKPGDPVAADEMLCELETDKVTVEVPAPAAGTLGEIVAGEGETVGVDALHATISEGEAAGSGDSAPAKTHDSAAPANSDPPEGNGSKGNTDVMVPTLGESVTEATVSTWFKKVGDSVAQDETLCELETDKVSVEVPAPAAGTLCEILAGEGDTVQAGGKLAVLSGSADGTIEPGLRPEPGGAQTEPAQASSSSSSGGGDVEDAPSAKKAMAEAGLSRDQVQGTGKDGRIMKEDVAKAAAAASKAAPSSAPAAPVQAPRGPVSADDAAREERVRMTRLRQTIARRLKDDQNNAAILTTYKDDFYKKHGVKLGFMSFFTKACCHALREVPEVNAEIDGTDIVYKNFVHMG